MTTITLEDIKATQDKLASMIAALQAQKATPTAEPTVFTVPGAEVTLQPGELAEANKPPTGTAPCARFCEHMAFVVQERMDRAAIQQLERENAELRKDAERYRFIRDADRSDCITPEISLYAMETLDEYVDAAIDGEAAMQKEQS